MEDHRDVLVLSATRTAIGKYGGGLAAVPPCDLAATVVREAVSRAGVEPSDVGHAVFGPHAEALARRCGARSLMVASYHLAEPPGAAGSMASRTAGAAYDTGGGR